RRADHDSVLQARFILRSRAEPARNAGNPERIEKGKRMCRAIIDHVAQSTEIFVAFLTPPALAEHDMECALQHRIAGVHQPHVKGDDGNSLAASDRLGRSDRLLYRAF